MTEQLDLAAIKRAAEEVKDWSNCNQAWLDTSEDVSAAVVGHIDEDGNTYPVATIDCDQYYAGGDSIKLARHYAAAKPDVVLELIRRLEEAEELAKLYKYLRDAPGMNHPYVVDGSEHMQSLAGHDLDIAIYAAMEYEK